MSRKKNTARIGPNFGKRQESCGLKKMIRTTLADTTVRSLASNWPTHNGTADLEKSGASGEVNTVAE